ncbi:MAG: glycosyltransferase family 4 protein [Bacilli bacterium]|nr:glycosyltransferase family 4 protein [Bacilli bacterium]
MKNICFFSGDISKTGGTERVTLLIANELTRKGYNIAILSYQNGAKPSFDFDERIKFYSLHLEKYKGFLSRKIMPFIELINFNKKHHQDIIINVDVLLANYTLPIKRILKSKIISWEHFNFRSNNGVKNRDYARKLSAKYADYIVVLTKADLKEYQKNLKIKNKIVNIYNPISESVKKKSHKQKIVLSSGRFTYAKNFQELIIIWEKIETKSKDWKLVICGSGEEFGEISKIVKDKKLKNVILPGFCKNMEEYYNKASIFVMTSRFEGFPMVLLEAQQHSIPLISYDCFTGPSEIIIDNRNGYLIPYGDNKEYEKKLLYLINNDDKLKQMSDMAYIDCERFSIDEIIKQWEKVINDLS